MRLYLIRHGEPDYDRDCLTENGVQQAIKTAGRLKEENLTAIYSSPMNRAKETASYTADLYGLPVKILDFMHEIDWGDKKSDKDPDAGPLEYDGHPWTLAYKMLSEEPAYVGSPNWPEHPYFRNNLCMDYYEKITAGIDGFLSEYGLERKDGLYRQIRECDDNVALFAHGGSGAMVFSHVFNLPLTFTMTALPYGVCSVSILDFIPQNGNIVVPRLELFNDCRHVGARKKEPLKFEK